MKSLPALFGALLWHALPPQDNPYIFWIVGATRYGR